eukprot:CAMPEP_0172562014 /NCGR_PEP_ID=MMETSP1067-20121228/95229_1 /TAXON_ID=265564 ORGANISM="Thalassiosira punctigera, Strain Tpunct2005C2" /NCGR_SAMPLE_ID=MMETSP1067 /ASSEMBLY_ACC=CAM_ASM_000444 /LENGTH=135 /DNA_ID=CAMNT_0013352159 /DNA_START=114 /DNA_END=521 /DNA_ORIENTATION=-
MSIPLQELEFDSSMSLQKAGFDLSIPMGERITQTNGDKSEHVIIKENASNSKGSTIILASFLVGLSSLVVGALALFLKMRQMHWRQLEENEQERGDMQIEVLSPSSAEADMVRVVTYPSFDDDNTEGEMREMILI